MTDPRQIRARRRARLVDLAMQRGVTRKTAEQIARRVLTIDNPRERRQDADQR